MFVVYICYRQCADKEIVREFPIPVKSWESNTRLDMRHCIKVNFIIRLTSIIISLISILVFERVSCSRPLITRQLLWCIFKPRRPLHNLPQQHFTSEQLLISLDLSRVEAIGVDVDSSIFNAGFLSLILTSPSISKHASLAI